MAASLDDYLSGDDEVYVAEVLAAIQRRSPSPPAPVAGLSTSSSYQPQQAHLSGQSSSGSLVIGRVTWLRQQLSSHGDELFRTTDLDPLDGLPEATLCVLCNMAAKLRSLQDKNQDMALSIKSLRSDCERMVQERGTYIEKVKGAEEERRAVIDQMCSLREEHRETARRWHDERDHLRSQFVALQHKDSTYLACLRKKEVEYEKLKKHLQTAVGKANGPRIDISPKSTVQTPAAAKPKRATGTPNTARGGDDDVARVINQDLEQRCGQLTMDNVELRGLLAELYEEVKAMGERYESDIKRLEAQASAAAAAAAETPSRDNGGNSWFGASRERGSNDDDGVDKEKSVINQSTTSTRINTCRASHSVRVGKRSVMGMPAEWVTKHLSEAMRGELDQLMRSLERWEGSRCRSPRGEEAQRDEGGGEEQEAQGEGWREEVDRLRRRLDETEEVIVQQDKVIRAALFEAFQPSPGSPPGTSDSWLFDERESLQAEKEALRQQRLHMDQERGMLQDAAEKLASEWGRADLSQLGQALGIPTPSKPLFVTPSKGDRSTPTSLSRRLSSLLLSPLLGAQIERGLRLGSPAAAASPGHNVTAAALDFSVRRSPDEN